jgi:hypothetical protein
VGEVPAQVVEADAGCDARSLLPLAPPVVQGVAGVADDLSAVQEVDVGDVDLLFGRPGESLEREDSRG